MRISIQRGLNLDELSFLWMERDNVKFAFVTTFDAFPDMDISADEIAAKLIPLRNELLQVIAAHFSKPTWFVGNGQGQTAFSVIAAPSDNLRQTHGS